MCKLSNMIKGDEGSASELSPHADLDAILEGIEDMRAGRSRPIDQARIDDRAALVASFGEDRRNEPRQL